MRNYKLGIGTAALVALVGGCISFEECRDKAVNAQKEEMLKYVSEQRFGKTLPKLSESAISAFFLTNLTDKQKDDIRKAVESEFNERRDNYVVQKWISYKNERIRTSVDSLISEATAAAATNGFSAARSAFERAREVAWRESVNAEIDGVRMAKVNDRVHEDAVKLLEETINVAEWPIIEKEMRLIADKAIKAGQPANGIAALRNYPNIRTYTSILDEKVGALVAELSRLNVPKSACDKIVEQTIRFMTQAANLMDTVDESRTVTTEAPKVEEPKVDETAYQQLLAEYKESLLLYDCTNDNTTKVVDWLAKHISELIANLPKPAPQKREVIVSQVLDKLGASAINKRIDALRDQFIANLTKVMAENEKMLQELRVKLNNDAEAARKQVVNILIDIDKANAQARIAIARNELLTRINPALWKEIEKTLLSKTDEFGASGKCTEGLAWLEAYPPIKTYPGEIDDTFDEIKKSVIDLGVAETNVVAIMKEVAKLTAEAEDLACYIDEVKDKAIPGKRLPKDKLARYEAQLEACRAVLVKNNCKESDKIIKTIQDRFASEIARLEADSHEPVLRLGSNAINVRIANLKMKCAHALIGRCVSDLLAEKKFSEARALLREVALTGNDKFDKAVYASRLGAINTLVNPAQLAVLQDDINAQVEKFWGAGDFRALKEWIDGYPYVHESYADILKALDEIQKNMLDLAIEEPATTNYIATLNKRISSLIESVKGGESQEPPAADLSSLEKALGIFEKAIMAQYYDQVAAAAVISSVKKDILDLMKKEVVSITTSEMNTALRAHIEKIVRDHAAADAAARPPRFRLSGDSVQAEEVRKVLLNAAQKGLVALSAGKKKEDILREMSGAVTLSAVDWVAKLCDELNAPKELPTKDEAGKLAFADLIAMLVDRQEYQELLTKMDQEVVYDSQIAMAEDAIAKQLVKKTRKAKLHVNAVLGEYARAMRLLKQTKTLNKELGTALVLGSVYLDQPAVFDRALELGADVNGVSQRDPLKRTALLLAVQLGRTAFIQRLVERGADVTVVDAAGDGALHYAVRRGNISVLMAMLAKNKVDAKNELGETALFDAARGNQPAIVEALLAAKADASICSTNGMSAFDVACKAGSRDVLDMLADAGSVYGPEQLIIAARHERLAVAQWLVAKGVDVNAPGVMDSARTSSAVKNFLLHEGGLLPRNTPSTKPREAEPEARSAKQVEGRLSLPVVVDLPSNGQTPAAPAKK